jgi:hypothetical protein
MKTEETTLDKIRTRPRFKMFTHLTKEEYAENLKKYLKEHKDEFSGNINKEVATICVETDYETYWKPRLSLRIEIEDEKTAIRGVFGPSSAVWTFFMFLYFVFRFSGWFYFHVLCGKTNQQSGISMGTYRILYYVILHCTYICSSTIRAA